MGTTRQRIRWAVIVLSVAAAVAALVLLSRGARGQRPADVAAGRTLAERLCVGCHVVSAEASGGIRSTDVLSFPAIANRPGQTAEAIAGKIVVPHPEMPQISLSRNEIAAVSAYILSLRAPAGGK